MTGVSECSQQRGNLKDDGYSVIELDRRSRKLKTPVNLSSNFTD
ncbi:MULTISPECIES: hypothetical protein [Photorhabdus]|nr:MULTISPECIES: hypothetical protein [Photorhabdus]